MWAVTRATSPNSPRGYLLIASNHIIADGRGTSSLVRALTASDITYIKQETLVGPTRIEETVQLKPSLSFLLPIAFRELFLTRMPYFVQKPFTRADPWPAAACDCSPMEVSEGFEVVTLDNDFVVALKAAGKARGVATLHPLLKVAYVAALWRVHASEAPAPARIQSSTARDERKPELGHAAITHNYVSSTEWDVRIGGAEVFWDMARELARAVSSPEGVAAGRMTMGLLSHIPDAAVDTSAANLDARKPTGWEDYFVRRVQSPTPYRDSMAMSNLGVVPLPPGADDYVWGQTASPFGSPYTVSILGHTGGVRVTSGFREGAVTDRERVKQLHTVFRNVLQRMVEGRDALTVAEITA
jgi:hypothetical protein